MFCDFCFIKAMRLIGIGLLNSILFFLLQNQTTCDFPLIIKKEPISDDCPRCCRFLHGTEEESILGAFDHRAQSHWPRRPKGDDRASRFLALGVNMFQHSSFVVLWRGCVDQLLVV